MRVESKTRITACEIKFMERIRLYKTRKKKKLRCIEKIKKESTIYKISEYLNQLDLTCRDNTKKQTS
jgi:hypothetical protein